MVMEAKIKLENVGKSFHTKRKDIVALKNVNMEFYPGEFVSIVGPSSLFPSVTFPPFEM